MLQNATYGIKLNGAIPYVTTIIQDSELAEVDLATAFDVSTTAGKTYPWSLGISLTTPPTVNGTFEVYVTLFNKDPKWAIARKIPIVNGVFTDLTEELVMYNFVNSTSIRLVWIPSVGSIAGTARVKLVINPDQVNR